MSGHTSTRDPQRLAEAVDPVGHDGDGRFVPDSVPSSLAELSGCDEATFQVMSPRRRTVTQQNPIGDVGAGRPAT
ncbi:MAG: hypothetical protein ACXV0U_09145 [Kineosporiaceae bacterium]